MKRSSRASVAIIGGSGLGGLLIGFKTLRVGTPFGLPPPILIGELEGIKISFLPRHGLSHNTPPHNTNYRANIFALHLMGVKRIFATNAVGGINEKMKQGDLVVPHDLIDFTKLRKQTFHDGTPVTHIDMTYPYCSEIRSELIEGANYVGVGVWNEAVLACTEGPRFETPAEIRAMRNLGCDIVGMTGMPETVLARELQICYATICYVSNMAAGLQERQIMGELKEIAEKKVSVIRQILKRAITSLPKTRNCVCQNALKSAQL